MKKSPPKCVQCLEPMQQAYGNSEWSAPFCEKSKCPNYGLLQAILSKNETIADYKPLHDYHREICHFFKHELNHADMKIDKCKTKRKENCTCE